MFIALIYLEPVSPPQKAIVKGLHPLRNFYNFNVRVASYMKVLDDASPREAARMTAAAR